MRKIILSLTFLALFVGTAYADYPEHWVNGEFLPMTTTYNQNEPVTLTVQFTPANGDTHPIVGHVRFTTIYYPDWDITGMPYPVYDFGDIGSVPIVDGKASITTSFSDSGQKIIAAGFYCEDGYYINEDIPDVWREARISINSTSIPEFPTVTLPIATMLGIMVIFRKKIN